VIFVDTSVWVDFFRGRTAAVRSELSALLDADDVALAAPVRIELLSGARRTDAARLRRLLSALPTYRPTDTTWKTMEDWVGRGFVAGQRFGVADLLIAAIAVEFGASLWSLDGDFRRLESLGLIELHRPAAAQA
jgi:predicted nucleic acid-binding protein